jgi:RNA polymerase subunit RPABC4/transcription elongation factor Spt4
MSELPPFRRSEARVIVLVALLGAAFLLLPVHGCLSPWIGLSSFDFGRSHLFWPPFFGFVGWGLIQLGLAVWVGIDANRRGSNGLLWGLLVFFAPIVGLVVYLILAPTLGEPRGGQAGVRCPTCRAAMDASFKLCPYCGESQRCGHCSQPLQAGWKVCPQCGTRIAGTESEPPTGQHPTD